MSLHEIVLPETAPHSEWLRGRAVQKMSGAYEHAALQAELAAVVRPWAREGGHGRVGTEWRFRVAPAGQLVRPLVADLAFLSYAALSADAVPRAVAVPNGAPTVAFEIVAPHDRRADLDDKVRTYLRAGSDAVVIVEPATETFIVHGPAGMRRWRTGERFTHPVLPGLEIDVATFFLNARR